MCINSNVSRSTTCSSVAQQSRCSGVNFFSSAEPAAFARAAAQSGANSAVARAHRCPPSPPQGCATSLRSAAKQVQRSQPILTPNARRAARGEGVHRFDQRRGGTSVCRRMHHCVAVSPHGCAGPHVHNGGWHNGQHRLQHRRWEPCKSKQDRADRWRAFLLVGILACILGGRPQLPQLLWAKAFDQYAVDLPRTFCRSLHRDRVCHVVRPGVRPGVRPDVSFCPADEIGGEAGVRGLASREQLD
eukprot:scaffold45811_cov69-Phaeocystis_antarctica.AAC.3